MDVTPEQHKALEAWTFAVTTALLRIGVDAEHSDILVDKWNRLADMMQWHELTRNDIDGTPV